jgi:hypothetical protein
MARRPPARLSRWRTLIIPACALVALACGQPLFVADPPRPPVIPREPYFAPPATVSEIASIGWGRSSCLGECPVYSVSLYSSGEARWRGTFPERYKGADTTTVDRVTFGILARRILDSGFFEWEELQDARTYDIPGLSIAVTLVDGRTKRVSGTGSLHQELGLALDSTAQTLRWHREPRPFEYSYRFSVHRSDSASRHKIDEPR